MYISRNFALLGVQKNFSPLGKILALVSTINLTGSVTPVTTKSTAIVTNSRVSDEKKTVSCIKFYLNSMVSCP